MQGQHSQCAFSKATSGSGPYGRSKPPTYAYYAILLISGAKITKSAIHAAGGKVGIKLFAVVLLFLLNMCERVTKGG